MLCKIRKLRLLVIVMSCVLLTGAIFPGNLFADTVTEEWVARYDGPANSSDYPYAIAVDSSGNVYVAGYSEGSGTQWDYATIKYAADGTQLWVARYNGPENFTDQVEAMALDSSGNVYVTGTSYSLGTTMNDYATIKYDTNGTELWVARYNGPENYRDYAQAIAVDSSGNVYVTGYAVRSGSGSDYATVKYDPNGNQLWVAMYDGPGSSADQAWAMALDSLGNVYVTGNSYDYVSHTYSDYATIKYDANGNQLWAARYDCPERAEAIAVDSSGNVCVTGGGGDYNTVKYDTNGNELWAARYDGPANSREWVNGMAVDGLGNVYVTGQSTGIDTNADMATVKYDSATGDELWVARYDDPANDFDYALAIALDSSGNVYVTGGVYGSAATENYGTVKYDANGNELWVAMYNGPEDSWDWAQAITVDSSGNVYVTGGSTGSGPGTDYATIKYSQLSPTPTWPEGSTLTASDVFLVSLTLTWTPAEDDVGVAEYLLFQDEVLIDNVTAEVLSYDVSGLRPFTEYAFKVEACDGEGYCSTDGPSVTVSTLTPVEGIEQLVAEVLALNLQNGISNSLDAKLDAVLRALDDANENNDIAAINALEAFINAVEGQRGDKISTEDADALIATAQEAIAALSSS
jgi:uncharacterized delta-60 repeat protein